jgi:hypothetical protein
MTNKNARSLGSLRAVSDRPNERHPNFLGNLKLQLHTLLYLYKQASETDGDEIVCNLAGWVNHDTNGPYITVELSPKFTPKHQNIPTNSDPFAEIFGEEEDPSREPFKPRSPRWDE